MRRLDGRAARVAGAGRGFGRAIALALGREGADVVVNWDYHRALDDYRAWLDHLDAARVFNAPDLVRWNLEKTYPIELAARGAPIPASVVVDADVSAVASGLERIALTDAVVKPTVGASGVGVERVSRGREGDALAGVRAVTSARRLLIQEFIPAVATGELAGVFFAGAFSHGLRRVPATGESRVNSRSADTRRPRRWMPPRSVPWPGF
jgi:glutathione synthase/RimK-type ligase-like ATP-grasp enzyme